MNNEGKPTLKIIEGGKVDPLQNLDRVKLYEETDVIEVFEFFRRLKRQNRQVANSTLSVLPGKKWEGGQTSQDC